MRSLSDKLSGPALALALGVHGCAQTPQPKQPEVIVVQIPPPMAVIENHEEALPNRRNNPPAKTDVPLTVERILADAPSRKTADIEKDIENYDKQVTAGNKSGSEIVLACRTSDRANECNDLNWAEHKRVRLENEQAFYGCDQITNDDQKWHACVMEEVEKDDQARAVRAYCSQLILSCVEKEFSK